MSTIIHMPTESDLALDLYEGDTNDSHFATYGSYGQSSFREFGKRIGLLPRRVDRILSVMLSKNDEMERMVVGSGLSDSVKNSYLNAFQDKMKRLG